MDSLIEFPKSMQHQSPECAAIHRQLDRSGVATMIAQMLLALQCREEGERPIRLRDLSPTDAQRFREAGEFIVMSTIHPGLVRIATMAAADLICRGDYAYDDDFSIVSSTVSPEKAAYLFKLAETVIRGYRQTLVFQSSDAHLDRRLDDRLQSLEHDGLVEGVQL